MPRKSWAKFRPDKFAITQADDGWDGASLASLARSHTRSALYKLVGLCNGAQSEAVQAQCAMYILDRGWGKTPVTHTGENGEGPITVEIVYTKREEKKTIDVTPDTKP